MTELTDAIYTALNNAGLNTTFAGGVHFGNVPDGTATPYLVVNVITSPTDPDYGNKGAYDATVQFTAIAKQDRATLVLLESVISAMDSAGRLTLTGGKVNHNVLREDAAQPLPNESERDPDAERLYGWYVEYTYSVR